MTKRIKDWSDDAGPRMRSRIGRAIDEWWVVAALAVIATLPLIIKKARDERWREMEYEINLKDI